VLLSPTQATETAKDQLKDAVGLEGRQSNQLFSRSYNDPGSRVRQDSENFHD
jgi:hypothetical protein